MKLNILKIIKAICYFFIQLKTGNQKNNYTFEEKLTPLQ